jgi:hypothetical protein
LLHVLLRVAWIQRGIVAVSLIFCRAFSEAFNLLLRIKMSEKQLEALQGDVSGSETHSPEQSVEWTEEEEKRLVRKSVFNPGPSA